LTLLIGVGNEWRRDDAAGLEVARLVAARDLPGLAVLEEEGEPAALLDSWAGADDVVVVDAVCSDAAPGTLHRLDASAPLPVRFFRHSSHAMGVPEAVELARSLGRLPSRLRVIGIEGERFEAGRGLSGAVAEGAGRLAEELSVELAGRAA